MSTRALYIWIIVLCLVMFGGGIIMFEQYSVFSKSNIETLATDTLGVKVTIGELHMNLEQGTVRVGHVQIFNPRHFSDGPAMEIQNVDIWIDTWSRGLIKFKEIAVSGVQVHLEVQATRDNLEAISGRVQNRKPPMEITDKEKLKIMIDELSIKEMRLRPRFVLIDKHYKPVPSSDIQINGFGYAENGLLVEDAIAQLWMQLAPTFIKTADASGFLEGMKPDLKADAVEDEAAKHNDGTEHLISE